MKVKVWNDNVHPYSEDFRGKKISIPAKGFIEMEYDEANLFRGTFSPVIRDADGNDMAEGYKMIRVEDPGLTVEPKVDPLLCQACRYLAKSEKDLDAHMVTHSGSLVEDHDAELEMKRKGKK